MPGVLAKHKCLGGGAKSAPSIFLPNEWSDKKKLKLAFKIKVI